MSSTRVAINRVVITGRAVTDPVTRNVKSHHGETTLTVFSIRTAKDTYIGSVIMEIHAWARVATQAGKIAKGRIVVGCDRRRWPQADPHCYQRRPPPATRGEKAATGD